MTAKPSEETPIVSIIPSQKGKSDANHVTKYSSSSPAESTMVPSPSAPSMSPSQSSSFSFSVSSLTNGKISGSPSSQSPSQTV
jgi:hypothetical protein